MRSIRRQLLFYLLFSLLGLFLIVGAGLYLVIDRAVYHEFNRELRRQAELLAAQVNTDEKGKLQLDLTLVPGRFSGRTLLVYDAAKAIVYRSPDAPTALMEEDESGFSDIEHGGEPYRRFTVHGMAHPDEDVTAPGRAPPRPFTLVYGRSVESTRRIGTIVAIAFVSASISFVALAAGLIVWVVHRGLSPLRELSEQLDHVDATSLKKSIALLVTPIEIEPMVLRLNQFMRRLDEAFERQARFTANAAHEFRTPIAEIRATAEVALMRPELSPEEKTSFTDVLQSAIRMQGVISTLLCIARSHESSTGLQRIQLADRVRAVVDKVAQPPQNDVRLHLAPEATICATPEAVDGILVNLMQNALEYRVGGGSVDVMLRGEGSKVMMQITNDAAPADLAEINRFGEQFWRNSHSRSDTDHSGLGCSLVKMYAVMIGASVAWRPSDSDSPRIVSEVIFPAAAPLS